MRIAPCLAASALTVLFGTTLASCTEDMPPASATTSSESGELSFAAATPASGGTSMRQLRADCPLDVEGADVGVVDTDGGVALLFSADPDHVADTRARVRKMARRYEGHQDRRGSMTGPATRKHMALGARRGMRHMAGSGGPMTVASSEVTDTDDGARLELRPTDQGQLAALRHQVRVHQQRMLDGECWTLPSDAGEQ